MMFDKETDHIGWKALNVKSSEKSDMVKLENVWFVFKENDKGDYSITELIKVFALEEEADAYVKEIENDNSSVYVIQKELECSKEILVKE